MVSNGDIVIPYENGEPMNDAQKIVMNKEEREKLHSQRDIVEHSQEVLRSQMKDIEEQITELETEIAAPTDKKAYNEVKEKKAELTHLKNVQAQKESNHLQNQAEIARMNVELGIYDDRIADLEDFKE